jgi:hypothetical protein
MNYLNDPDAWYMPDDVNVRPYVKGVGWYCVPPVESKTESEAWQRFIEHYAFLCTWLRGKKYWRTVPKVYLRHDFENGGENYRVGARFILVPESVPLVAGLKEANFIYDNKEYKWDQYK